MRVGTRPPSSQRLVLGLADLTQEITVSNAAAEVGATAGNNVDAITIDQNMLESLPVFDNDFVATMSQFLDAGSIGNGGVTIVVNGMEVSALNVSASAVQQIRINQDPYSAEYSRPGRGRVEILTKPGTQEYHGDGNVIFRDAHLNARNAFATTTKPPEQRRIYEGFLGGPLGHERQDVVHAVGERRDPGSAGVRLRGRAGGDHPGHAAAQERAGAADRQHHAADQRQEHVLDPAELPVRERREPRRRRHDAGQRRDARSRTTSSRSPTRSRRSCARRC